MCFPDRLLHFYKVRAADPCERESLDGGALAHRPCVGHDAPMITPAELQSRIRETLPDAAVVVRDLTGTSDHYAIDVTSAQFEGLPSLQRHRLVHAALRDVLGGPLHAIQLVTRSADEAARTSS